MDDPQAVAENQRGEVLLSGDVGSLSAGGGKPGQGYAAVVIPATFNYKLGVGTNPAAPPTLGLAEDESFGLGTQSQTGVLLDESGSVTVRRLTPLERERLMSWPDDWTAWGLDEDGEKVMLSDTARDRLTGNGVVTSMARWIADRIAAVDED